ncbi:hypothetical protein ABE10_12685 [Bacillus toyonensis]|nr:hypothetical protein [Bacillus toyonensis]
MKARILPARVGLFTRSVIQDDDGDLMNTSNRGRPRRLAVALFITAGLGASGLAASSMATAQAVPSAGDYDLATLTSSTRGSLPPQVSPNDLSLDADTLRPLAEDKGTRYWVALDDQKQVCLVAFFGADEWAAGKSCSGSASFLANGVGLRLYGPEGLIEAYLTPDDVTVDGPAARIADNLYTVDPAISAEIRTANNVATAEELRSSAEDGFQLALFEEPFSLEVPR